MIDTIIGKYRIVGQLGRGGTGIVYKAIDETLGREVAIKILNPDLADSDIIKRFQVEATALAKLNHPGIATIYELFRSQNDLLMVMELVRGETLEKLAERLGPLDPQRAVFVVDQLLSALAHAHRAGVVHRDIKPTNVMVTTEGIVKIMDFGVARVRDAEHTTSRGKLVGTPAYMPPEQVLGEKIDERSDLYSVGVVLYRLLTGALPFASDSSIGMLQRHVSETPIPMRAHREGLPAWCETITARAMAKSAADRFQTADEFREALGHASGMLPAVDVAKTFAMQNGQAAEPVKKPDTVVIPRGEVEAGTPPPPSQSSWIRGRFVAGASMLTIAVVGLLIVLYVGLPKRPPARGPSNSSPTIASAAPQATTVSAAPKPAPAPQAPVTTTAVPPQQPTPTAPAAAPPKAGATPTTPAKTTAAAPTTPAKTKAAATPSPAKTAAASTTKVPPTVEVVKTPSAPVAEESTESFPVLVFNAKTLVPKGDKEQERDAQLVLAGGTLSVKTEDQSEALYAVSYKEVVAVYYSRSRDPMWNSPRGPEAAARTGGGFFRKLGMSGDRHWITIRTGPDRFIILRVKDTLVREVLTALEKRTRQKPYQFNDLPAEKG